MKQILIIGGGITGLASAFYLQREIKENKLPYKIKLVEATESSWWENRHCTT